eukprot:TRINITY_DN15196_c0_g1_i2.p1 TRINITY_DN15196_c0_g1~~TRINITY_DN15196_c0_g1_i2.p1  ORF type:complete len:172 (-),score=6.63 TRINITY_DN15196_c0_g1_i2:627-1142(-)
MTHATETRCWSHLGEIASVFIIIIIKALSQLCWDRLYELQNSCLGCCKSFTIVVNLPNANPLLYSGLEPAVKIDEVTTAFFLFTLCLLIHIPQAIPVAASALERACQQLPVKTQAACGINVIQLDDGSLILSLHLPQCIKKILSGEMFLNFMVHCKGPVCYDRPYGGFSLE